MSVSLRIKESGHIGASDQQIRHPMIIMLFSDHSTISVIRLSKDLSDGKICYIQLSITSIIEIHEVIDCYLSNLEGF